MTCPDCGSKEEVPQSDRPGLGSSFKRVCMGCGLELKVERGSNGELLASQPEEDEFDPLHR